MEELIAPILAFISSHPNLWPLGVSLLLIGAFFKFGSHMFGARFAKLETDVKDIEQKGNDIEHRVNDLQNSVTMLKTSLEATQVSIREDIQDIKQGLREILSHLLNKQ